MSFGLLLFGDLQPMAIETPQTYSYEDHALGPAEPIVVETRPGVFYPTSTTRLLLRATRRHAAGQARSALDLGCGCGIVAIALRRFVVPEGPIGASDISPAAIELARLNAERHEARIDVRCGSLFDPWVGRRFDLILDDVAAMAEPLARASRWYPPEVPSEAGEDGTRWITDVLAGAPQFLAPGGRLIFPVLTLADQERTLAAAQECFLSVQLLEEEWYPLGPELLARLDLIEELSSRGIIEIRRRGSRQLWATKIYEAANALAEGGGGCG